MTKKGVTPAATVASVELVALMGAYIPICPAVRAVVATPDARVPEETKKDFLNACGKYIGFEFWGYKIYKKII
jgi:hypothetical protein